MTGTGALLGERVLGGPVLGRWAFEPGLDARTLARLLASGELDAVWMPDRATWVMRRRLSRRGQLVWTRSRVKNELHAVLMRCLVGRAPFADLLGSRAGAGWAGSS